MKIPQQPPQFADFAAQIDPKRLRELLAHPAGPTINGRYAHWDKVRRLAPPAGLSPAEWWFTIKLARSALQQLLPLADSGGRYFVYGMPDPTAQLLHTLDRDAAGQIIISEQITTPEIRDQYVVSSLMEEAITSSQIEGAATTRFVAKEMLRSGRKPRDRSEQMIANNYAAMQKIREICHRPLTKQSLLDLHRILTEDTLESPDAVGRFRRGDEDVRVIDAFGEVLHDPPRAHALDARIAALCEFANGKTPGNFVHPVVRAIVLHFLLAYEHPFVDGNGRCARALFYWSMLRAGYWLCEFISISNLIRKAPAAYGRAFLYTETDDNDLTYFLLYHLDLIRRAIDALQEYLKRKMSQVQEAERLVRNSQGLNHRQISLLGHALRHPNAVYTFASHQNSHAIVYQTARTDLFDLQKRGLLQMQKSGRIYRFFPVPDLAQRMKKLK